MRRRYWYGGCQKEMIGKRWMFEGNSIVVEGTGRWRGLSERQDEDVSRQRAVAVLGLKDIANGWYEYR